MQISSVGLGGAGVNANVEAAVRKAGSSDAAAQVHITNNRELQQAERQGMKIPVSDEQLIKAIERAVRALEGPTTSFQVSIHEKTKEVMIKVMNKDTGEMIREIPPEKTLDMVAKMMEIAGILINERV